VVDVHRQKAVEHARRREPDKWIDRVLINRRKKKLRQCDVAENGIAGESWAEPQPEDSSVRRERA
jgi:hypothetical protein